MWSIIYRMFIVTYSVILIVCWNQYNIPLYILILLSASWYFVCHLFRGSDKNAYYRMLADFVFVLSALVVSSAPIELKTLLTMMPIINQHNHSARKKTWQRSLLFLLLWSVLFLYCIHQVNRYFVILWYISFCAAIVLIDWLDCYIKRISEEIDRLTSQVLDVADAQNGLSNLLKNFRDVLNGNALFKCVKDLYLVEILKDKLHTRSSSYFDPRIVFSVEKDKLPDLGKKTVVTVIPSPRELFSAETCCKGFYFEKGADKFLFVVVFHEVSSFNSITSLFLWQLLSRSVPNVIRVYRRRQEEHEFAKKTREDFVKNSQYIASVRAAAHYIRNNINPFLTVSEMLTEFLKDANAVTKEELFNINKQLIVKQRHIQDYVTKILESPRKDVFTEDFISVSASSILKNILLIIEENADSKIDVQYSFENLNIEEVSYKIKKLNLSVLLENLIRNAFKHSDFPPVLKCLLQKTGFRIDICNKIRPASLSSVQQFVGDLTSSSKEEIIKRKGEGLLLIRNTCDNLNAIVTAHLSSVKDEVFISITFGEYNE